MSYRGLGEMRSSRPLNRNSTEPLPLPDYSSEWGYLGIRHRDERVRAADPIVAQCVRRGHILTWSTGIAGTYALWNGYILMALLVFVAFIVIANKIFLHKEDRIREEWNVIDTKWEIAVRSVKNTNNVTPRPSPETRALWKIMKQLDKELGITDPALLTPKLKDFKV